MTALSLGPFLLYVFDLCRPRLQYYCLCKSIFGHLLCSHILLYHVVVHVTLLKKKLVHIYIFHNSKHMLFFLFRFHYLRIKLLSKTTLCVLFKSMDVSFYLKQRCILFKGMDVSFYLLRSVNFRKQPMESLKKKSLKLQFTFYYFYIKLYNVINN